MAKMNISMHMMKFCCNEKYILILMLRLIRKEEYLPRYFTVSNCPLIYLKGVVSKETVVLRRWGSSIQKFGLSTELIMLIGHR